MECFQLWPHRRERREILPQFGVGDQRIYARIAQDIIYLVRLEEVVNRHSHGSRVKNAKQCWDKLRTILQPQRHPITGLNTQLHPQLF